MQEVPELGCDLRKGPAAFRHDSPQPAAAEGGRRAPAAPSHPPEPRQPRRAPAAPLGSGSPINRVTPGREPASTTAGCPPACTVLAPPEKTAAVTFVSLALVALGAGGGDPQNPADGVGRAGGVCAHGGHLGDGPCGGCKARQGQAVSGQHSTGTSLAESRLPPRHGGCRPGLCWLPKKASRGSKRHLATRQLTSPGRWKALRTRQHGEKRLWKWDGGGTWQLAGWPCTGTSLHP